MTVFEKFIDLDKTHPTPLINSEITKLYFEELTKDIETFPELIKFMFHSPEAIAVSKAHTSRLKRHIDEGNGLFSFSFTTFLDEFKPLLDDVGEDLEFMKWFCKTFTDAYFDGVPFTDIEYFMHDLIEERFRVSQTY